VEPQTHLYGLLSHAAWHLPSCQALLAKTITGTAVCADATRHSLVS
jgi:hypothetical protein